MFLDASVIVAVLKNEPESPVLLKAMEGARGKLRHSGITRLEASMALARTYKEQRGDTHATAQDFETASQLVSELLEVLGSYEVHITGSIADAAIRALAQYGHMVGHNAKLNFGDALSYACAKAYHTPLLYKGKDFKHTDLL
ncbi:type II toxin-antitoxin system VapC family toxin [Roseinatronobacter monicus]|uniref:Ribonuclease VapC n=1 Tax=Roseinatronobacter monicus TaxID=393481 RepID=A0A543K3A6_9RHOB|nr:type II toxin-antitoxin system VapC family toxin [Roseinatronobacter monicus]TQM89566.1 ribonuclease VapC [Roseinatronobacter monicus]